ncbi:putative transmembrane protein [Acidisarcina polymorpha]|uniref:Putative transmembrane protein n=2 Tax=Acidisarcina polymorpha TaxID=2211140 RepID=A0A2Z5FY90_9BACT|nr:putative transmembrane protein [Acidisarcina polymorpha]
MDFSPSAIAGLVIAASFAAGLNIYATIMTLGALTRLHWVVLPPGLEVLGNWWVIGASVALFSIEFVADKIPAIDLIWNALHTFIRIPLAALLAYRATNHLSPEMQLLATTAGGLIALAAHSSKTAARTLVTPSPEPFTNIALSTGEDAAAVGLTWTATHHPWLAGGVAAGLTLLAVLTARWMISAIRSTWDRLWRPEQSAAISR